MSIPRKMTVSCSKCGKPLSVTVFDSVNSDYAETLPMQIMSGNLFNVECPHCKYVSHLEYDILYHDMRHDAMVWVLHKNSPEYATKLAELRSTNLLPYKTLRVVENMNALKEKVSCLESGRDDRVVELCKVFTVYNLLAQKPDFAFRNAFYSAVSGQEIIYIYDEDGDNLCSNLSDKTYDYIEELYLSSNFAKHFDKNYAIVDYDWAEQILIPLMEAEAQRLASAETDESPVNTDNNTDHKKVTCPKCHSSLPSDSEFCQKCGTKIHSDPIQETPNYSNTDDQLLSEAIVMEIKGERERERLAQIQREKNIAIQKRVAAIEAANKRKKIISTIVVFVVVAIIAVLIAQGARESAFNGQLRNFATEAMNDDYTNVYANVVSMEPEYFMTTKSGSSYLGITEVICKCKTVEGKTIWVTVDIWDYPGGSAYDEDKNEAQYYSKSNPMRLTGTVTTAEKVVDRLEKVIGNIFVLDVDELEGK